MNAADEIREIARRYGVVSDISRDNVGGQDNHTVFFNLDIHVNPPRFQSTRLRHRRLASNAQADPHCLPQNSREGLLALCCIHDLRPRRAPPLWKRDGQTVGSPGQEPWLESTTRAPLLEWLEATRYVKRMRGRSAVL